MNPEAQEYLNKVLTKSPSELSEEEAAFLRARVSYLKPAQLKEYAEVLTVKEVVVPQPTRSELNARAVELGIEHPEKLSNKEAVEEAIKEAESK